MKIAYLLGSLGRGGAETLLLDVFKNASKANFEFIGIYRRRRTNSSEEKFYTLTKDFYDTEQKFVCLSPKFPFDFVYLYKLRKFLKKEQISIVHAQQSLDAFYAWLACLFTNIKVVTTFHGYDNLDLNKKSKLLAFIAKRTNRNFFVSQSQKDFYIKKYGLNPAKQTVVYNGISFDKFGKDCEVPDFLKKSNSPMARLKMAMVGNFGRVRDQSTLCKFLKLLHDKGIDFDFYFVGSSIPATPWLFDDCVQYCNENGLNDCVHFLGGRNDVPAILKNIDTFLYSTDHDTFGIAVIEAIAVGIPVFVNDWGVMTEITNNGELATLYKTKDEQDLFEKFMLFLQKRNEYIHKAKENSHIVRVKFSIEKHLQSLKKEYNSVC